MPLKQTPVVHDYPFNIVLLSTGSGRHCYAAHEIHLIGCCILLNVVPKTVPLSGSSQSPLNHLSPFSILASLKVMHLLKSLILMTWMCIYICQIHMLFSQHCNLQRSLTQIVSTKLAKKFNSNRFNLCWNYLS